MSVNLELVNFSVYVLFMAVLINYNPRQVLGAPKRIEWKSIYHIFLYQ